MNKPMVKYGTAEEYALLNRVSAQTILRWHRAGIIKGIKIGRRLLFDMSELATAKQNVSFHPEAPSEGVRG